MITITIKTASLLSDIRIKSHMNTERIKDPDDHYAVRAGEENNDEVMEGLQEAWNALKGLCRRFLAAAAPTEGSDIFNADTADKLLLLDVTERRTQVLADTLAQAIHNYLVYGALRRFYTSAAMGDLVTIYAASENEARDQIIGLLYRKMEPVYTEDEPAPDPEP